MNMSWCSCLDEGDNCFDNMEFFGVLSPLKYRQGSIHDTRKI